MKPGAKYYEWEGRGVPLRLEIGPRDVAAGTVMLARRTGGKKESLPLAGLAPKIHGVMDAMQQRPAGDGTRPARGRTASGARPRSSSSLTWRGGGFVYAGFCGRPACEAEIKEQTKATIRVLPDEEFRSPQRRRPACGAEGRALRRRYGRKRTEAGGSTDQARRFADAGLERRGGVAVPRRRGAVGDRGRASGPRPTSTTPT